MLSLEPRHSLRVCRLAIIIFGRCSPFMKGETSVTLPTYGILSGWSRILTTHVKRVTVFITQRKSRLTRQLWHGAIQKASGYRIAPVETGQSHGMEPNFVH